MPPRRRDRSPHAAHQSPQTCKGKDLEAERKVRVHTAVSLLSKGVIAVLAFDIGGDEADALLVAVLAHLEKRTERRIGNNNNLERTRNIQLVVQLLSDDYSPKLYLVSIEDGKIRVD